MKAIAMRIFSGVTLVLSGYLIGTYYPHSVHAQSTASVPLNYGKFVAFDPNSSMAFVDGNGTVYVVDHSSGVLLYSVTRK